MTVIYKIIARWFPELKLKLAQARISESGEQYIKRTVTISTMLAFVLALIAFAFTKDWRMFLGLPIFFGAVFFYFMSYADAQIARMQKDISREIIFAGRFLVIELESGVPIYQSFRNLAESYEFVGRYFGEVVQRVDLGTSFDEALNEAVQLAPSPDLRRVFWQVLNSLKTGSEVSDALNAVFDQIVREQQIMVKEYGRKLNPMAMFYMMMAVIVPSLGTIMLIVLSTFIGIDLNALFFTILVFLNFIIQLMFLAIIKSQRPPVDI